MRLWGSWGFSRTATLADFIAASGWPASSCNQARQVQPAEWRGACSVMALKSAIKLSIGAPAL